MATTSLASVCYMQTQQRLRVCIRRNQESIRGLMNDILSNHYSHAMHMEVRIYRQKW